MPWLSASVMRSTRPFFVATSWSAEHHARVGVLGAGREWRRRRPCTEVAHGADFSDGLCYTGALPQALVAELVDALG